MLHHSFHAPFLVKLFVVRRSNDQGILRVMMISNAILVIGAAPG